VEERQGWKPCKAEADQFSSTAPISAKILVHFSQNQFDAIQFEVYAVAC